jgi:hypothetical protein
MEPDTQFADGSGMTGIDQATGWTHLCLDDDTPGVVVTTKEGDRFILTLDEAIRACKSAEKATDYMRQFQGVLDRVTSWLTSHADGIELAYLTLGADGLDFTVVLRSMTFERDIEEDLTELDIEIAQHKEFDLIRLNVLSLPRCSDDNLGAFVRPRGTWIWRPQRRG